MTPKQRKSAIAKLHIAKHQIGMADEDYRAVLMEIGKVKTSTGLTDGQLVAVLRRMAALGFTEKRPAKAGRKPDGGADKLPLLQKIDALLAEQGLSVKYADAIGRRMFKINHVNWLRPDELRAVVAALVKRGQKTDPVAETDSVLETEPFAEAVG